jgi:glycosyltransferase involved in cell wall biosynthesis
MSISVIELKKRFLSLKNKLLFIGPVNGNAYPIGGDQYKNQLLIDGLQNEFKLIVIDTYNWKKNPLIFLRMFYWFVNGNFEKVVLSSSTVSALRLIKWINYFPEIQKKLVYFVIGGELHYIVKTKSSLIETLLGARHIVVETTVMKESLFNLGLYNVMQIPNFKVFQESRLENRNNKESRLPLKLVFLSRICEEKGVDIIFTAMKKFQKDEVLVDFYGPISAEYNRRFETQLALENKAQYKGLLNLKNEVEFSYDELSKYHVFLFPTFWKSEGHAGAIIDALCSGLAIIATVWNSNSEFITNNGILIKPMDSEALVDAIETYMSTPSLAQKHGENSLIRAKEFHFNQVFPQYLKTLC